MLTTEQVSELLADQKSRLQELGVQNLLLVGSVARGNPHDSSDLDFVVDFDGPATFDRFMGLSDLLESVFKTKVDLTTRASLRKSISQSILKGARRVA